VARTALIVDDSTSIRQMISFTLREAGFEVLEGVNGSEALAVLQAKRVDVIITDLNMPVMDGLAFIRAARARTETKFTPILMLTTESHAEKRQAAKAAGATGWIVKPFQPTQLLQVIGKVLP
jgi:two-component system chemotaxis response regulator CheY